MKKMEGKTDIERVSEKKREKIGAGWRRGERDHWPRRDLA